MKVSRDLQPQTGYADVNGTQLYYEAARQGYPQSDPAGGSIVLIHAGLSDCRMWDDQFSAFAHHYRIVRFGVRGFGKSTMPLEAFSVRDDLNALLTFLGVQRASLVGLSMGGSIAIDFTLEYPDKVVALIAASCGPSGHAFDDEQLTRYRAEMNAAYRRHDVERAVDLAMGMWLVGPARTPEQVSPPVRQRMRQMLAHYFSRGERQGKPLPLEPPAIARLTDIHVPTLVMVGDQDVAPLQAAADLLASHVPAAHKVIIAGAAHMINMEQPAQFNQAVLDFLGSLPGKPSSREFS
jgi:pimeloyl-ACP methyl ester carboxylesterase